MTETMTITKAFKFRLRPTYADLVKFQRACESARYAWNWTLSLCEREYEEALAAAGVLDLAELADVAKRKHRIPILARARAEAKRRGLKIETPGIGRARLYKLFCAHRDTEMGWLREMHSHTYSYPIERVVQTYKNWWKAMKAGRRAGAPKHKPPGQQDSFTIQINAKMLGRKKIRIPGVGWVACHRDPLAIPGGEPCSVTVSRVADRWYASIPVRNLEIPKPATVTGPVAGVDLGVRALLTVASGGISKVEPPRPLEKELRRLARLQRAHARKQKGSRRRYLSQMKIARLHADIAAKRSDYLHKVSHRLVHDHRLVVVEGFDVHDLVSRAVDKSPGTQAMKTKRRQNILDGASGELRRQLSYKAPWYGSEVLVLDKLDPTDQSCHRCGAKNKMEATTSEYVCSACGLRTTRQENTALLLESFGRNPPESTGGHSGTEARGPDGSASSSDESNQPGRSANFAPFRLGAGSSDGSRPFLSTHAGPDVNDRGSTVQNDVRPKQRGTRRRSAKPSAGPEAP